MKQSNIDDLSDYLFAFLEKLDVEDDEKKILTEYIESVTGNFEVLYKLISSDEGIARVIKSLEGLTGEKDV